MKIKEILEGDVIYSDKFGKREQSEFSDSKYDSESAEDILKSMKDYSSSKNSLDKIPNEFERKRFERMLSNTNGKRIEGYNLIPYMRKFIKTENKKEFSNIIRNIMLNKDHLYDSVKNINNLLQKNGTSNRVVGVSQNEEDWYFSE